MAKLFFRTMLIVSLAGLAYSAFARDNSQAPDDLEGQWLVSLRVGETAGGDSQEKILAESAIAAVPGRPFSFESGGNRKSKTGDRDSRIGTRVRGTLRQAGNGNVHAALNVSLGEVVSQVDDPATDLVKTVTLDMRTVLRPGETKRLRCSASQWCEVRVESVE